MSSKAHLYRLCRCIIVVQRQQYHHHHHHQCRNLASSSSKAASDPQTSSSSSSSTNQQKPWSETHSVPSPKKVAHKSYVNSPENVGITANLLPVWIEIRLVKASEIGRIVSKSSKFRNHPITDPHLPVPTHICSFDDEPPNADTDGTTNLWQMYEKPLTPKGYTVGPTQTQTMNDKRVAERQHWSDITKDYESVVFGPFLLWKKSPTPVDDILPQMSAIPAREQSGWPDFGQSRNGSACFMLEAKEEHETS